TRCSAAARREDAPWRKSVRGGELGRSATMPRTFRRPRARADRPSSRPRAHLRRSQAVSRSARPTQVGACRPGRRLQRRALQARSRERARPFAAMIIPILETDRLLLRPLDATDFPAWAEMYANAEFATALGYAAPLDIEEAWRALAIHVGQWMLRGFGIWAVV